MNLDLSDGSAPELLFLHGVEISIRVLGRARLERGELARQGRLLAQRCESDLEIRLVVQKLPPAVPTHRTSGAEFSSYSALLPPNGRIQLPRPAWWAGALQRQVELQRRVELQRQVDGCNDRLISPTTALHARCDLHEGRAGMHNRQRAERLLRVAKPHRRNKGRWPEETAAFRRAIVCRGGAAQSTRRGVR